MAQGNAKKIGLDHGDLVGKADDDHTQYLNDTRHGNLHASIRAERITSNQTVSSSTFTTVVYNSIISEDDADDHLDINTSTGVATINTAGLYLFSGGALSNLDSWNRIIIRAILNGSTAIAQMDYYPRTGSNAFILNSFYSFSASDTLEIQVRYTTHDGADFDILDDELSYFSLVRLS